jgi:signal transduction histidine kinase
MSDETPPAETKPRPGIALGLSARLLLMTVFFVMVAEVLIYAPSIGRFRKTYLEERIVRGHLAALALEATPNAMLSEELERKLLRQAEAHAVALKRTDMRMLALTDRIPPAVDASYDLRTTPFFAWIHDALEALAQDRNRVLRVIGTPPDDPTMVLELILDETPMREAMVDYSIRILQLSIGISLSTATLVFLTLQWLMVRPMRRITASMMAFRLNPEDDTVTMPPTDRRDEIGIAQRELAVMQEEVRSALRQQTRLATLGAAVAKINHDLRNSLATAVLVSDRLSNIADPEVQKVTPRLYDAIDHAVSLCSQTLNYVSDAGPGIKREDFMLAELVNEVRAALRPEKTDDRPFAVVNRVDPEATVHGDRRQLFRVLSNLARNARESGAATIVFQAQPLPGNHGFAITAADDGPGLPPKARDKMFQPFAGSARKGGTGLGLVICRDIMRAHGGDVTLVETGPKGTVFRLALPSHPHS